MTPLAVELRKRLQLTPHRSHYTQQQRPGTRQKPYTAHTEVGFIIYPRNNSSNNYTAIMWTHKTPAQELRKSNETHQESTDLQHRRRRLKQPTTIPRADRHSSKFYIFTARQHTRNTWIAPRCILWKYAAYTCKLTNAPTTPFTFSQLRASNSSSPLRNYDTKKSVIQRNASPLNTTHPPSLQETTYNAANLCNLVLNYNYVLMTIVTQSLV